MQEYFIEIRRTLMQIAAWAFAVCAAAYIAGQDRILAGFLLGTATSIVYYLLMCYRVKKCIELPAHKAVSYMRIGWLVRFSFVALMLGLSVRLPFINFWAAVVGLFSLHAVIFFNAIVVVIKGVVKSS